MAERKSGSRRLLVRSGAVVLVGCLLYGAVHWYRDQTAVHVYIRNAGTETLRDLTIYTGNDPYPAGHLGPGQRVHVRVWPGYKGAISVAFLDETGRSKRFVLEGYVDSWFAGWINATIDSQRVREEHGEFWTNVLP